LYFEISAKTGFNINKMFYTAVAQLPFFDNFDVDNKADLAEELGKEIYLIVRKTKP
jgi:hypothetical protein